MSFSSSSLNQFVIQHTLKAMGICSKSIENLLLGTAAAQEDLRSQSEMSTGIGVYGISKETHCRLWDDYLALDPDLASEVRGLASQHEFLKHPHIELASNLAYATAIAWMIYQRDGVTLPHPDDIEGLAQCWVDNFVKNPDANGEKQPLIDTFVNSYRKMEQDDPSLAA
jgi:hypothetical protein